MDTLVYQSSFYNMNLGLIHMQCALVNSSLLPIKFRIQFCDCNMNKPYLYSSVLPAILVALRSGFDSWPSQTKDFCFNNFVFAISPNPQCSNLALVASEQKLAIPDLQVRFLALEVKPETLKLIIEAPLSKYIDLNMIYISKQHSRCSWKSNITKIVL